jgi:predicted metal-dependent phosphoesterase TrpH
LIKADLHVHTEYSIDSTSSLEKIVDHCLRIGINCLAIADHNTIAGALRLKEIAPFKVIVAEEILTSGGEVIGMFLKDEIPGKLTIEDTIAQIKAQKGIVCIPHPYDNFRLSASRNITFESIMPYVDIVEIYNSRSFLLNNSIKSKKLADRYNKPGSAGSDAHIASEIGRAYVEMEDFSDIESFLAALANGRAIGHKTNPFIHFASSWARLTKIFS